MALQEISCYLRVYLLVRKHLNDTDKRSFVKLFLFSHDLVFKVVRSLHACNMVSLNTEFVMYLLQKKKSNDGSSRFNVHRLSLPLGRPVIPGNKKR